jgi:hypothetical protein
MKRLILPLALLAAQAWATVPQRLDNPWEGAVSPSRRSTREETREMPDPLGPFCYLREYEQVAAFLAHWQQLNPGLPHYGGMIEAEAGPLGGVIQTDNTLEAIWVWSRRRAWTGLDDLDARIALAWAYCQNYPAWSEEGGVGDNYYRDHNCAWGLAACREYEAATGDTTFRAYGRTCAAYVAQHPLPLPTGASLNAMVTGWCAGSLYDYAVAEGREDWRQAALTQGLDLLDFVETNPETWLAWNEWAMSGGTMLWGLCRSVFTEAPLYGQTWLQDHVFQVPDWADWENVAGYDWDSSWNVAYANGLYSVKDAVGDPVSTARARRITDGLLSHDTDDDGGIMADSHDPATQDMSWVTCYLARFGLARLIGDPPARDAGALRLRGLRDEDVVVQGQPLELSVIAANHGLQAAAGVQVCLEVDGTVAMSPTDLDYADLDTLTLALWTPGGPGRHRLRAWTLLAEDENPANDTLVVDVVALAPPLAARAVPRAAAAPLEARLTGDGRLAFTATAPGTVRVELFNLLGQRLLSLEESVPAPGRRLLSWRGRAAGLAQGVYLLRVEANGAAETLRAPLFR